MDDKTKQRLEEILGDQIEFDDRGRASLYFANLAGANLSEADLSGVNLSAANLSGANLAGTNLTEANLSETNLSNVILAEADLTGANLFGADLSDANLSEADLSNADLFSAKLSYANLGMADLSGANLLRANLSHAKLFRAVLSGADLSEVDLSYANLPEANLSAAILTKTSLLFAYLRNCTFSSRSQLNLKFPLTEDQLESAIFIDEVKNTSPGTSTDSKRPFLRITLRTETLTPFNFSYLMLAIEGTYNNLFYLATTKDNNIEVIKHALTPYYQRVGDKDAIKIVNIVKGSFVIEMAALTTLVTTTLLTLWKTIDIINRQVREYRKYEEETKDKEIERENSKLDIDLKKLEIASKAMEVARTHNELSDEQKRTLNSILRSSDLLEAAQYLQTDNKIVNKNADYLMKKASTPLTNILYKFDALSYDLTVTYCDPQSKTSPK